MGLLSKRLPDYLYTRKLYTYFSLIIIHRIVAQRFFSFESYTPAQYLLFMTKYPPHKVITIKYCAAV